MTLQEELNNLMADKLLYKDQVKMARVAEILTELDTSGNTFESLPVTYYNLKVTPAPPCVAVTFGGHSNPAPSEVTLLSPFYDEITLNGTPPFTMGAIRQYPDWLSVAPFINDDNKVVLSSESATPLGEYSLDFDITNCNGETATYNETIEVTE